MTTADLGLVLDIIMSEPAWPRPGAIRRKATAEKVRALAARSEPDEGLRDLGGFLHARICDIRSSHDETLGRCYDLAREYRALAAKEPKP